MVEHADRLGESCSVMVEYKCNHCEYASSPACSLKMLIYKNNGELGRSPFGGRVVELHQLIGKAAQCWSATCRSISFEPAKPTDSLLPILLSTPDTPDTP